MKIQQTAVGLALVLVVALSACGASSLPTPTTAASTTTTTTLTTTTTTTVAVSAVALVKSAAESLATARSVEVGSALSEGNGPTVQGAIRFFSNGSFAGDASVRIVGGPTVTTYFRVIGDREYVMAPSLLWIGLGYSATVARELAPRWVVAQVGAIKGIDDSTLAGVTAAVTSLESESMTELPRRTVLGWSALGVQAKLGTLWVTTSNPTRPVELVLSDDRGLVEFYNWNQGAPPTPPLDARPLPAVG